MESPRITVTSLGFLLLLTTDLFPLLSPFPFDKSLFDLPDFLSMFGVAVFSCNDVVSFLVQDCFCKSMSRSVVENQKYFL